tara:strand:- start:13017 stop:14159 length:1143 start_codon:yes stop_codon:yes gene_type:complete
VPNVFSLIIDKSVLQSLQSREAEWLFHHFRVNIPPVFFCEILGDLKKSKQLNTGTAHGDARMLAAKIESAFIDLNAEAHSLVAHELHGYRFALGGLPILENAERIQDRHGKTGLLIDQTPMQRVLDRWREGDFNGLEQAFAQVWRHNLAEIDLEEIIKSTKHMRNKALTTPAAVMQTVEAMLFQPNRDYANLKRWMQVLAIPPKWQRNMLVRWKSKGRPPPQNFAPYTAYMARLELFFYMGVAHQVVSTRASNRVDMDYLMYLPFTSAFASGDKLHAELFSEFASPNQVFIERHDLKAALAEMADFYDSLSDEEKSEGSFTYADYPPTHMHNAVTIAYDKIVPGWREGANMPQPPRDPETERQFLEQIQPMMDAIRSRKK